MGTGLSRFDALSVEAESTGIPSVPNCQDFVRSQQTNLIMKKRAPISFKSDYDYKVKDSQGHILLIIKSSPEFCFTKVLVDREGQVVVGMKNKPSPSRSRTFYLIVQKMGNEYHQIPTFDSLGVKEIHMCLPPSRECPESP